MTGMLFGDLESAGDYFRARARQQGFTLDPSQKRASVAFEHLAEDLLAREAQRGLIARLRRPKPIPGLYLWGGVGRGKSFMMDGFFEGLNLLRKQRWHFHRFMQHIHEQLAAHAGKVDPLPAIAQDFARDCQLLCLDEFHVRDITDAMLLRRLLESLQASGVVLVTTSNCAPHQLYADGLQRSQFLPAIRLIDESMTVLNLDSGTDYRLRKLETQNVYLLGDEAATGAPMAALFAALAGQDGDAGADVPLPQGRSVRARRFMHGVAWFDFAALCGQAHGKADLIEIARNFHTVLLSGVPRLGPENADQARRFIWMIDEFYDRRVKLVVSAAAPPDQLCLVGHVAKDFARSASRLTEMQTRKYLALAHLA
ncbi:MAG: AFG1 family ATPase [Rhodocyclaceae bacterium]|nr:AFG1 family ATPase [Rhodocyclaceae bacterium]